MFQWNLCPLNFLFVQQRKPLSCSPWSCLICLSVCGAWWELSLFMAQDHWTCLIGWVTCSWVSIEGHGIEVKMSDDLTKSPFVTVAMAVNVKWL